MFKAEKFGKTYRIPNFNLILVREGSNRTNCKTIRGPEDAHEIARQELDTSPCEKFLVILLNTKNAVIGTSIVSSGTLNAALVHPREVFQRAILSNAAAIIVAHNHPSGNTSPSSEDIALTKKLVESGKILDIPVLDHIIIGDYGYASLKEKGLL